MDSSVRTHIRSNKTVELVDLIGLHILADLEADLQIISVLNEREVIASRDSTNITVDRIAQNTRTRIRSLGGLENALDVRLDGFHVDEVGVEDAYDQLSVRIATKPLTSGSPSAEAKVEEVTGVVEWAEKLYIGTDTGAILNMQLRGDGQHTYRGRITYDNAKDFTKVQAGDTVVITFLNTGKDERAIATVRVIPPTSNKG